MHYALAFVVVVDSFGPSAAPFEACGQFRVLDVPLSREGELPFELTASVAPATAERLTGAADRALDEVADRSVSDQARVLLGRLRAAFASRQLAGVPPVSGSLHDDGSFTLELRFPDRRLAFTIERDPAESGWHFVSSPSSGSCRAYGGLSGQDLGALLDLALVRPTLNS